MTQNENTQSQPKPLTRFFASRANFEPDFRTPILNLHRYYRKPEPGEDCEYLNIYELRDFTVAFSGMNAVTTGVLRKELVKMGFGEGCVEIEGRPKHGYMVVFLLLS